MLGQINLQCNTYTEFITFVPIPTIHQRKLTLYFAGLQHKQKLIKLLPCFDPKEPVMTLFALQFDHGYYPWHWMNEWLYLRHFLDTFYSIIKYWICAHINLSLCTYKPEFVWPKKVLFRTNNQVFSDSGLFELTTKFEFKSNLDLTRTEKPHGQKWDL